jgi:hypothetical protein
MQEDNGFGIALSLPEYAAFCQQFDCPAHPRFFKPATNRQRTAAVQDNIATYGGVLTRASVLDYGSPLPLLFVPPEFSRIIPDEPKKRFDFSAPIYHNYRPHLVMPKQNQELTLLNLLKSVLPKAVPDAKLADKIYSALEKEITAKERVASFEKFCKKTELPDLEKKTLNEVKKQFEASFGEGNVSIVPHPAKKAATIEVETPQGIVESVIKVGTGSGVEGEEGEEEKIKYVPFPVAMETDPELVWMLARDERMTPEDAAIALSKAQESFWESKGGQQHLRNRTERTFPEIIAKVPSKMLGEVGLRRHYKDPEPVKQIKLLKARKHE